MYAGLKSYSEFPIKSNKLNIRQQQYTNTTNMTNAKTNVKCEY